MLEQLRHPPRGFEEVIRSHFWIKRDEICDQITKWITEMQHLADNTSEQHYRGIKIATQQLNVSFINTFFA